MSTPPTTRQDDLRSRLPGRSQFVPEVAEISGAMFKATLSGSIPQTTISLMPLRRADRRQHYHTVRQTGDLRKAGETEQYRTRSGSASPASCTPGHPPTTTTRRCGRSPWRSAKSASSSPSLSSPSRSPVRSRITTSNTRQPQGEDTQPCPTLSTASSEVDGLIPGPQRP
jgi:hypothetical protein